MLRTILRTIIIIISLVVIGNTHAFCQLQHFVIHGNIKDQHGDAAQSVKLTVSFNEHILASSILESDGSYELLFQNYGGIEHVILQVELNDDYTKVRPLELKLNDLNIEKNLVVYKLEPSSSSQLTRTDIVRISCSWGTLYTNYFPNHMSTYSNKVVYCSPENAIETQDRMFRMPTGTFTYYKPDLVKTYHKKITSSFTIIDKNGKPIKNARVTIKIPDDELRWGLTDENGNLTMHMEFEKGALDGKIYVTAEGYTFKKLLFQRFVPNNNTRIIQLHKNH